MENFAFYLLTFLAILSALTVVFSKSPVSSALSLVVNFFCIAGLYLLMEAQFLAIVQIMVYAGAIMVLFIFTIMLLNLRDDRSLSEQFDLKKGFVVIVAIAFLLEILFVLYNQSNGFKDQTPSFLELGTVEAVGKQLFTGFVLPFEMISVLLLTAVVGAVVLAKKKS